MPPLCVLCQRPLLRNRSDRPVCPVRQQLDLMPRFHAFTLFSPPDPILAPFLQACFCFYAGLETLSLIHHSIGRCVSGVLT